MIKRSYINTICSIESVLSPSFQVGTAQVLLGGRMGFPTKNKINAYLAERAYAGSYSASPGLNFVGIFQKPGSFTTE